MTGPSRFAFVDESEAVRRLGVDRNTVLALVQAGRLKAFPGVGKGNFYKLGDLLALAQELHPPVQQPEPAGAPDEVPPAASGAKRPQHDPAYKVHLRLQADLKWYDLGDADLRAWVRELHPDGYQRQRTNITKVIARLQQLLTLMDDAAATWAAERQAAASSDAPELGAPDPSR
ncbi:MAG: hypothetical protein PVSMB4_19900 [Ktedonobacterales bacterium]